MFYKMKKIVLFVFAFLFAFSAYDGKAQGLVSLSEEAMFDDELETNKDFPMAAEKAAELKESSSVTPEEQTASDDELPSLEVSPATSKSAEVEPQVPVLPEVSSEPVSKSDELPAEFLSSEAFTGDLFSKMSDLEKKTTLMNLELRREKLQNEIEAVKNQRRQALQQEKQKEEEARLKALEKEKNLEKKLLEEQQKLRELDIKFETLRQEKLLGAYKNKMLEETQKWIDHDAGFYKQIADLRQSRIDFVSDMKDKMQKIKKEASLAHGTYISKMEAMKKEKDDLQQQINILKERIVFMEKQHEEELAAHRNPFAEGDGEASSSATEMSTTTAGASDIEPSETGLSQLYAVTEIRGKGDELIAKLINKNGTSFYVKKGTTLQSGHVIKEITSTYVMADRLGQNDYLYFAAGGILPSETTDFKVEKRSDDE